MEAEGWSQCSQRPATDPYPQADDPQTNNTTIYNILITASNKKKFLRTNPARKFTVHYWVFFFFFFFFFFFLS
jgi:hypothetical protein